MFVVLKLKKWESLDVEEGSFPAVKFNPPDDCPGFLPVFTDRDKAIEFAGDERLVKEIREETG